MISVSISPPTSSLIAFEATARLGGVIRASEELNTSQSAISRHIRNLENALGDKLFQRQGRGVVLTRSGEDYYVAVKASLESLHAAGRGLRAQTGSVIIACTHEISYFLLLPAMGELKRSMGGDNRLRILNADYDMLHLLLPAGVDIIIEQSVTPTDPSAVKLLDEEIVPVGSPAFVKRFERVLGRHPRYWVPMSQGWTSPNPRSPGPRGQRGSRPMIATLRKRRWSRWRTTSRCWTRLWPAPRWPSAGMAS